MENNQEIKMEPKWYVLHTFGGYEATVKDYIENIIENGNLQEYITDIKIPVEQTMTVTKSGKRKIVDRKIFACYVFVKMTYTTDIAFQLTNITGVTGFVGPGGKPLPLTDDEVKRNGLEKVTADALDFIAGDTVLVISGAIAGFEGKVISINPSKEQAKVEVEMFERSTQVDVEFSALQKVKA